MAKAAKAAPTSTPAPRLQEVVEIGHRYRQEQADPLNGVPSENERMLRVAQADVPTPAPTGAKAKWQKGTCGECVMGCGECLAWCCCWCCLG